MQQRVETVRGDVDWSGMAVSIIRSPRIFPYSCKNIKLFRRFRRRAIDFSPSDPMFALDAARIRNANS
jgi:hypothetical protein